MEEAKTLGGRIQAHRKAAGLSQEALGERLGVSRQAVSRWEADAAVPELEKLIAMSRLFAVTVGTLLGVEPPAGAAGPAKETGVGAASAENGGAAPDETVPAPELTDRELAAAEAIAEKYLAAVRPRWSRNRKLAAAVVGFALVLGAALAAGRLVSLNRQMDDLRSQMAGVQSQVSAQLNDLTGQMTGQISNILDEKDNILSNHAVTVTDFDAAAETVTLTVTVFPKEWTGDTAAVFTAVLSDGRQFRTEALRQGSGFAAENWELPMDPAITLSAALTDGGVTRSSPFDILYDCLPGVYQLRVEGSWDMTLHQGAGKVSFGALDLHIQPDPDIALAPTAVDLCLYRNQETEPEQVLPVSQAVPLYREQGYVQLYDGESFQTALRLERGETLVAAVRITDDHGQTTWTVLAACRYPDSAFADTPEWIAVSSDWVPGEPA